MKTKIRRQKIRQQEFGFVDRGGKRRGAGRKPKGERAGVSHAGRPRLCARHPVLVTLRLRAGLRSLRYHAEFAVVVGALADSARETFHVVHHSVQSNHLHLMVEAADELALSRGMNSLTVRLVRRLQGLWRRVGAELGARGRVLADRYHAVILTTPRAVRNALVYLFQNARKHHAWRAPYADPYSSAASFDGWIREVRGPRAAESDPALGPWVARAWTWLLSIGWRRHGRLDPAERPAAA